jgi:hypothetical protein
VHLQSAALINEDSSWEDSLENSFDTESQQADTPDFNSSDDGFSTVSDSSNRAETSKVSLHRLVQEALIYNREFESERQEIFDATIKVIYKAFPAQINGETLAGEIQTCTRLIPHIMSLSGRYQEFRPTKSPLIPSLEFGLLLKSCIW